MQLDKYKLILNTFLVTFWVRMTFGFISQEILTPLLSLSSMLYFLTDALVMFIGLIVLKNTKDKIFIFSFIVVGYFITCIHNNYSIPFYINGLRDFIYIISLIPIYRYFYESNRSFLFISKFDKSLYIFLIIQAICITFQFLKYGANDHGGGSMGNGASGLMSTLIYIISFYLMQKKINYGNYFKSLMDNKILIILLFPTFLNETKISFIYLALYFILLMPLDRKAIIRLCVTLPILLISLPVVSNIYMSATGSQQNLLDWDYYWEEYLMADESGGNDILEWTEYLYDNEELEADGSSDIPRFTKYLLLPEINSQYPGHAITGYGIGQFKGGTTVANSKFYLDNEWMLRGTVPYGYHAYIQIGFFSILFFVWFWIRLYSLRDKTVKGNPNIQIYLWFLAILFLCYNDFYRHTFVCIIFFYIFSQALNSFDNTKKENNKKII